jgi:iron complex outermembrane receptor protein
MKNSMTVLLQTSAITAIAISTAAAQDTEVTEVDEAEGDDEVVVTGSRIKSSTFSSPVSMDVLEVEDARVEGIVDIAGLLQTATAASGSSQVTSSISTAIVVNGGLGAETVGLRGLAANRTLDLINGRRAGPSGTRGSVSSFDLGTISLVGIERVDILKDGASSVYGSDAIAGVINYITDKSGGGEIDFFTSIPEEGGGEVFRGSATYGKTFDHGRFRVTADYIKEEELQRGERDFLDCASDYTFTDASLSVSASRIDPRTNTPRCSGSPWGHVWVYQSGGPADNIAQNPRNLIFQFDRGNNLAGLVPAIPTSLDGTGIVAPAGWYQVDYTQDHIADLPAWAGVDVSNNNPRNVYDLYSPIERAESVIPERERMTLMFDGEYELDDNITAYGEALFNRRQTYQNGQKQYWTYQYGQRDVFAPGNPIIPDSPYQDWGGTNTWFSPTAIVDHGDQETTIDYFRLVGGLRGQLGENFILPGWDWDAYIQHSNSSGKYWEEFIRSDSTTGQFFQGGSCVGQTTSGATGEDGASIAGIPCIDVRWFDPGFLAGELTQAERDFLLYDDEGQTDYTQTTIEGYVSGDVMKLPAGQLSAALGVFYQDDEIYDRPSDTILAGNGFSESNAGITEGSQSTKAIYTEARVPLLSDVTLFDELTAVVSGRFTEITSKRVTGETASEDGFNYRATVNWTVSDILRFRGSIGTSFRAPGLFEQFLADETGALRQGAIDPCVGWGTTVTAGTITPLVGQNCAVLGIPDDYTGAPISAQIVTGGGFGVLEPETSNNKTIGFVLTPSFVDLSFAVDYFDIKINDEISTLTAGQIVTGCFDSTDFPNDPLCGLFDRAGDSTGQFRISEVRASFININTQSNKGLDFTGRYRTNTPWGPVSVNTQWSHQLEDEVLLLADGSAQYLNGGIGEPEWTGLGNISIEPSDKWLLRYSFDYIGQQNSLRDRFDDIEDFSDQIEADGGFTLAQDGGTVYAKYLLEPTWYHNISAQYKMDGGWTVRVGINNIFDEHPPASTLGTTFGLTPVLGSQYDLLGRRAFLNVSKKFG